MNRADWQQLATERLLDTQALMAAGRWSAGYYLAGYALECGLKACLLHYIERTGIIFSDRKYAKNLGDCWTHDLNLLVDLAGLKVELGLAIAANPNLGGFWGIAKDWSEASRYEQHTEIEAQDLLEAIANQPDGVLGWLATHW